MKLIFEQHSSGFGNQELPMSQTVCHPPTVVNSGFSESLRSLRSLRLLMQLPLGFRAFAAAALCLLAASVWQSALAFPPAPFHLIYGVVRDQYGTPLMTGQAKIVLQTSSGVQISTSIVPGAGAGMNYQLQVPMDTGLTSDLYRPNALVTAAPFKIYVVIGTSTNLPIQMTGNFAQLGKPGQRTRLDLTLGTDANGNGIPDAWENAFLAALGLDVDPFTLKSGVDYTHDGLTLQQEFLAGNYPFNPDNSFTLKMVDLNGGSPLLEFTTMTGRSYTVLGSADLQHWSTLSFLVPAEGASGATRSFYFASDIRTLRVQALQPASGPTVRFFRLMLQ